MIKVIDNLFNSKLGKLTLIKGSTVKWLRSAVKVIMQVTISKIDLIKKEFWMK